MVFFDTKTNENGTESIIVGRQWWLFLIITIPLTILVFATWIAWQRYRNQVDSRSLGIGNLNTEMIELGPILEEVPKQG